MTESNVNYIKRSNAPKKRVKASEQSFVPSAKILPDQIFIMHLLIQHLIIYLLLACGVASNPINPAANAIIERDAEVASIESRQAGSWKSLGGVYDGQN